MAILPPDPVSLLRGSMGPVHGLLFRVSPYVEHLYAAADSGRVHVWDLRRSRELSKWVVGEDPCLALRAIGEEGLLTQGKGGIISIWQADGSKWILDKTVNTGYCGYCRCQVLSQDQIWIPLLDSAIGALSLKTSGVTYKLDPLQLTAAQPVGEVMAMKPLTLQGNDYVLAAYESGDLAFWDIRALKVLTWLKIEDCPMCVDFDVNLMRGLVGSASDKLQALSLTQAHTLCLKSTIPLRNAGTSVIAIRPDNKVFTAGGWDGRLRIFSWKTLRPLAVLDQHRSSIHDIAYSACKVETWSSNCLMAASGKEGNVSLWDLYNK